MSDERKVEFDVEALLLTAGCIFLWLSLFSYDPADSVGPLPGPFNQIVHLDNAVYPANSEIQNWCGWFGALASQLLIQGLGFGSLVVVTGLSVLTIWMFRVHSNYVRASRQLGWLFVIVAVTTFVSLLDIRTPYAPVIGSGGYLGATASTWLNEHFALLGSLILTVTVLIAGLLLSTDYFVIRVVAWLLLGGASVASSAAAATKSRISIPSPSSRLQRRRPVSDVDGGVQINQDPNSNHSVPIRIRGQKLGSESSPSAPEAKPEGTLGKLKSVACGLLGSGSTDQPSLLPNQTKDEPTAEYQVDEDEEEFEEEFDELAEDDDAELEPEPEYRELEFEDETVQLRADSPHTVVEPEPDPLKIKTPKSKKAEKRAAQDSLVHLDDTKLPAGTEEYVLPGRDLLLESDDIDYEAQAVEVRRKAKILEKTFNDFGFNVRVVEIETGPVIAQYEVELEAGLRLSKITGLADDLAIALRVPSVRIVAPIPGKNTVGIEVPNETRQVVRLREVIEEQGSKGKNAKIPLFLGKDVSGNPLTADLATLPHLLIAGRTGTGKSVCLNAIIASILMTKRPDEVRMLMIDPKMVELSGYGRLPHLMHPVVTDMRKAEAILAWAVDKMEERYALLARAGVRHITSYNELGREELLDRVRPETPEEADYFPDHLPFIVIVADEMADLMMTAGKEVEQHIIRLAQKSRAVGIHLILATQKPTVDVITGLIKSNLPARISFQVASRTDSRVVLDEMGADKLLGNGDMLFLWPGTSMLLRGQGTYMSDEEINAVVDHCSTGEQNFVHELVNLKVTENEEGEDAKPGALKKRDDLYAPAVDVVVREGRGSCSLLQRALGIGYGRAARLIDYMAEDGIVGQYNGSQAREVLLSIADWEAMQAGQETNDPAPTSVPASPTPTPPRNRIRPHDSASDTFDTADQTASLKIANTLDEEDLPRKASQAANRNSKIRLLPPLTEAAAEDEDTHSGQAESSQIARNEVQDEPAEEFDSEHEEIDLNVAASPIGADPEYADPEYADDNDEDEYDDDDDEEDLEEEAAEEGDEEEYEDYEYEDVEEEEDDDEE